MLYSGEKKTNKQTTFCKWGCPNCNRPGNFGGQPELMKMRTGCYNVLKEL